jgi:hypothetical protein
LVWLSQKEQRKNIFWFDFPKSEIRLWHRFNFVGDTRHRRKKTAKHISPAYKIVATARFFGILQKNFNVSKTSRKDQPAKSSKGNRLLDRFPVTAATLQSRRSAHAIAVRFPVIRN